MLRLGRLWGRALRLGRIGGQKMPKNSNMGSNMATLFQGPLNFRGLKMVVEGP